MENFKLDFGTQLKNTYMSKGNAIVHLVEPFIITHLIIFPDKNATFSTIIDNMCASFDFDSKILEIFLDIFEELEMYNKQKILSDVENDLNSPLQLEFKEKPVLVDGLVLSCCLGEQTYSTATGEKFIPIIIQDAKIAQTPTAKFV